MGNIADNASIGKFQSLATPISDDSNYIQLEDESGSPGVLALNGSNGDIFLTGIVGAGGALGHFKITAAAIAGGTHVDLLEDSDFDTPTQLCPFATASLSGIAANGVFQIALHLPAVAELKFYAKKASTDTTLKIEGTFGRTVSHNV